MIPTSNIKSKHEGEVKDVYVQPDVWATKIVIDDVRTEEWQGKKAYTSYRVNVTTTFPQFNGTTFTVRRRYNDFIWLRNTLETSIASKKFKRPVERIPELPGDTLSSFFGFATHKKGRFEDEFIEDRRKKLEVFMNRISNHPQCSVEPALIRFLKEDNMSTVQQL